MSDRVADELDAERAAREQAEQERDFAVKRYAEACGVSTDPIPPEDIERASRFVRDQGWTTESAEARVASLEQALTETLTWMERAHGGDPSLRSEEYYIARDFARAALAGGGEPKEER